MFFIKNAKVGNLTLFRPFLDYFWQFWPYWVQKLKIDLKWVQKCIKFRLEATDTKWLKLVMKFNQTRDWFVSNFVRWEKDAWEYQFANRSMNNFNASTVHSINARGAFWGWRERGLAAYHIMGSHPHHFIFTNKWKPKRTDIFFLFVAKTKKNNSSFFLNFYCSKTFWKIWICRAFLPFHKARQIWTFQNDSIILEIF